MHSASVSANSCSLGVISIRELQRPQTPQHTYRTYTWLPVQEGRIIPLSTDAGGRGWGIKTVGGRNRERKRGTQGGRWGSLVEVQEGRQAGEDLVQPECFAHAAEMLRRSVTSHPASPSLHSLHLSLPFNLLSPLLSSPLLSSPAPYLLQYFLRSRATCHFDKQIYWLRHISSLF